MVLPGQAAAFSHIAGGDALVVPLTSASPVLGTMQQDRAGVRSAVPNAAASSFTIHLSKAVTASTSVAWFAVN